MTVTFGFNVVGVVTRIAGVGAVMEKAILHPARGPLELRVEFVDSTGRLSAAELQLLGDQTAAVGHLLGLPGEVRVRIVNDAQMTADHREFLDIDQTTDVLTFDCSIRADATTAGLAPGTLILDVDINVCLDEAERRATEHGWNRERELLLYVVHGLLHCTGFDDLDEESAARMHAREDELLTAIGVGATYSPGRRFHP